MRYVCVYITALIFLSISTAQKIGGFVYNTLTRHHMSNEGISPYDNRLKYYFTEGYSHDEPPIIPPGCYRHASGSNPEDIFDDAVGVKIDNRFHHPPLPGLQISAANNPSNTQEKNIMGDSLDELPDSLIWTYCFLDITPFIDSFLGNLRIIDLSSPVVYLHRKKDITHPGFYLNPPSKGLKSELTQTETTVMNKFLNESLGDTLRPFGVADFAFIHKYENVMSDTARTEFFGKADIGGVKISVGGWFGKFASIGVFADFNDIDSFLELANVYFNLPPFNRDEAVSHKKDDEYFFSLKDKDNMFLIRGYDTIGECWRILNEPGSRNSHHKVIELIKYYDKEFMP